MKNFVLNLLKKICSIRPLKNYILMESIPDFEGNSRALFDQMIRENLNEKYKIVWFVDKKNINKFNSLNKYKNVTVEMWPNTIFLFFKYIYKYGNSICLISENKVFKKIHNKNFALHLTHGTPIKNTGKYMYLNNQTDKVLYQSDNVKKNSLDLYNISEEQLICLGFPRNDKLFLPEKKLPHNYIVWMPTFRKSKKLDRQDCNILYPFGIPIFQNEDDINYINNELKKNKICLYIKPHPAQDLDNIKKLETESIKIINDEFIKKQGMQLYEFLAGSKGLVTDYSSVYCDYLLLDRPIGLTLDDFEEYKKKMGFIVDYNKYVNGFNINSINDFCSYILTTINPKLYDLNKQIYSKNYFNKYQDNNSSVRVLDFIKEELKKRKQ